MSQKFILSVQNTPKKHPFFREDHPKKFSRKPSSRQRSFDSKKSKDQPLTSSYIRNVNDISSISRQPIQDQSFSLLQKMSRSIVTQLNEKPQGKFGVERFQRKGGERVTENGRGDKTWILRVEMLETQLTVKQGECQRYKAQFEQQRERRRKSQYDKRGWQHQLQQLQRLNQSLSVQNKKLQQQKQYLVKQVEFLEKITYDENTRILQSYREKHMQDQIVKLKEHLYTSKSNRQFLLEEEIEQLRNDLENNKEKMRAVSWVCEMWEVKSSRFVQLYKEEKELNHERIISSQEYISLKERYRRFIESYKSTKTQNWNLRKLLQGQQAQFVLSESEGEEN